MNTTKDIQPLLLSGPEAAALCGVRPRTWWRWTHSGKAPAPIKFVKSRPGTVRYVRAQIEQWIQQGCPHVGQNAEKANC
jgi:predicted DNA-binding transcriptional regulator AlpA